MAMTSTTNPADVANRLQTFFSKKLLAHAVNTLRLTDYGMQAELPQKMKSKTIRWFRPREASTADVVNLTEGVPSNTFTEVTMDYVEATLVQYAEQFKLTDVLRMIDAYEPLEMAVRTMGEDAALKADTVIRDAIVSGTNDSNGLSERFCGVTNTLNSQNDFDSLEALSAGAGKLTRDEALKCVTQLKVKKTPKINGGYVAVLPPQVAHDLMRDPEWLRPHQYQDTGNLYRGELGQLDGVRYVEATNPFQETVYKTYSSSGDVFTTLFLGRDAYGVPKMAGTSSPWAPSITILDKPDKSDPANQFCIAVWKIFFTAKLLNINFLVQLRSKSTFA